jgi:predicted ribosome quality control (RQC) complex YloA/Tae2 family protein
MKLVLDVRLSLDENAAQYFNMAKKARGKIAGAKKAIVMAEEKLKEAEQMTVVVQKQAPKKIRKRVWFEKFKWFMASNGMLVIAGRDATTNEQVIKKHMDEHDIIVHTDAAGSPFVVIKTEGKPVSEIILQEAADFCASHSKAWKLGLSSAEVYWVSPEQVSKEAKAGEFMSKGSFMIYGKRNYIVPKIGLVAVPFEDKIMIAPLSAATAYFSGEAAEILQGDGKTSDVAKKVFAILKCGELDDIIALTPAGGAKVKKILLENK